MNNTNNLTLLTSNEKLSYHIHPSYLTYKHVNPVTFALNKELPICQVNNVIKGYRRSVFTEEAVISDYMRGNLPKHDIIKDAHYYKALDKVKELFQPPSRYRPV